MRLTSDMFVSALLRRVSASGGFGAIIRRGNRDAGAIFITMRSRDGETVLFGPAPQLFYSDSKPEDRWFCELLRTRESDQVDRKIEKEARFDPDIWAVEIEPGATPLAELITIAE